MAATLGKPPTHWFAYNEDRKILGKELKLKTLVDKLGTKNIVYSRFSVALRSKPYKKRED